MKNVEFINLHLQLSEEDVDKIDEWKVKLGMRSRSEAIRHIIREFSMSEAKKNTLSERAGSGFGGFDESKRKENIEEMIKKMVKQEVDKKLKK
ncbi:MAG TPA: hypothetical protein DIV86_07320 [Alphaproteobacteria bacterium]|nr:hypothetical protein [Alphaproteobacteria bacterium]